MRQPAILVRPAAARRSGRSALLCGGALALAVLAGCNQTSSMHTGSVKPVPTAAAPAMAPDVSSMNASQLDGLTRAYGAAYSQNSQDRQTGLAYASTLSMTGRNDQSLAVMQQMAIAYPEDRQVLAAYGKALAGAGDLEKALETVRRAQTPDQPDWGLLSTEGAILDQLGQRGPARALFFKALDIRPNEPSVLSNLGMSYLMANELPAAERYLSQAVEQPGADSRVRQNLALVVGLQGRFDEAERIASAELSPEEAAANVSYLRGVMAQQNTWSDLEREGT